MYIVDTSVWVEMLSGTPAGERAKETLKGKERFALDITLAELAKWCVSNGYDKTSVEPFIEKSCNGIVGNSRKGFLRAGELWHIVNKVREKGRAVGMMDCIIASAAMENDFTVLAKDRHFLHFPELKKEII